MPLPHPVELYAEVKKELQLDDAALEKLLDANERWPRSSKEDGWVMSHEAIRMDLRDLAASVEALSKTAAGSGLQSWQVSATVDCGYPCRIRGSLMFTLGYYGLCVRAHFHAD